MEVLAWIGVGVGSVMSVSFKLDGGFRLLNRPIGWAMLTGYLLATLIIWGLLSIGWTLLT